MVHHYQFHCSGHCHMRGGLSWGWHTGFLNLVMQSHHWLGAPFQGSWRMFPKTGEGGSFLPPLPVCLGALSTEHYAKTCMNPGIGSGYPLNKRGPPGAGIIQESSVKKKVHTGASGPWGPPTQEVATSGKQSSITLAMVMHLKMSGGPCQKGEIKESSWCHLCQLLDNGQLSLCQGRSTLDICTGDPPYPWVYYLWI